MKVAICNVPGSFSEHWINYCETNSISYKLVNAYDSDIVSQVKDCDCFMWHHNHADYRDKLFAKQLIYSLQMAGKKVFPDYNTCWHFDDKVGQKYLLESIGAPLVPSYVFYTKKEAMEWINSTTFPKVFKLRGGAGSANVKLIKTKRHAKRITSKSFSSGFSAFDRIGYLNERYNKYRSGKDTITGVCKGIGRLFIPTTISKMRPNEKGYVYFQDFIPNLSSDFRVKVVSSKCWAFQRKIRRNDFRASGSGNLVFDNNQIPLEMIKIAFQTSAALKLQSVAFDFVLYEDKPLLVEMSYCYGFDENEMHNGYWTKDLLWHEDTFNPFDWMVEDLISKKIEPFGLIY